MALWNEPTKGEPLVGEAQTTGKNEPAAEIAAPQAPVARKEGRESLIGLGVTIEGKIEGQGDMRIAGTFKGDVNVKGNLTIEPGAHITGQIGGDSVTVGGKVDGNINAVVRVNLLETCKLMGDLAAPSLSVAAGSRMRGKVEFGWNPEDAKKLDIKKDYPKR